ncbi:TraR/DksA C4-type zinc finger protein [Polaromonas sp.]|uniref:TraR/DksA C4-type zinc finger protein n=1 Tax=Polaromonas sp. TaxID=1869339 RepID=UPI00286CBA8D|nr:TraR/DksA C4-type zinc finger protein [Polaromonas sp.]
MDEKYFEQASRLEQSQRDARLRDVQARLAGKGQADCAGCGEAIPSARRLAVPSAIRCVSCEQNFEFKKGLGL